MAKFKSSFRLKRNKGFKPKTYSKSTIYIGAGATGRELVKQINQDMRYKDMDFSPLLIHAFQIWHGIDHAIEKMAKERGVPPAELINTAYHAWIAALRSNKAQ